TISPTDAEARGSWLNIAASSVGLAAGAASGLLSKSAAAGTNLSKTGQVLAVSVEVLRHANLVTGGAGVLNSLIHIILKVSLTERALFFLFGFVNSETTE
ncbi:jg3538, partial [Pararge aegeria aegeria]